MARNPRLFPLRLATAAIWIAFGLGAKVLGWVPRHRRIVAVFFGDRWAGPFTLGIGLAETGMGLWILSGRRPKLCAATQTAAIAGMNSLELAYARHLLLAPIPMVLANAVLLGAGWFLAWRSAPADRP